MDLHVLPDPLYAKICGIPSPPSRLFRQTETRHETRTSTRTVHGEAVLVRDSAPRGGSMKKSIVVIAAALAFVHTGPRFLRSLLDALLRGASESGATARTVAWSGRSD